MDIKEQILVALGLNKAEDEIKEVPLLSYDQQGNINILPLEDSKMILDYVWDNAFQYNGC